jgi:hypothetical protein
MVKLMSTCTDYLAGEDDGIRWELIDGLIHEMAEPATGG